MYGSWSRCNDCGSYFFNDEYFREAVYKTAATSPAYRRQVPTDPLEHRHGEVGISSRWWYLLGMYKPLADCHRCTKPPQSLLEGMEAHKTAKDPVDKTGELYVIPCIWPIERRLSTEEVKRTWPRYQNGHFQDAVHGQQQAGESMLELSEEEYRALQIVVLRTEVKADHYV